MNTELMPVWFYVSGMIGSYIYIMTEKLRSYFLRLMPSLSAEAWAAYEGFLEVQEYKKGDMILRPGDICRYVWFINSGLVRTFYIVDGRELINGFIPAGEFASEYASFIQQAPSMRYLDALADCTMLGLRYDHMQQLYAQFPEFQVIGRKMAEFLFTVFDNNNASLVTMTAEERYQRMVDMGNPLLQTVPQYMLASYLGITPEHLSRIRKRRQRG